MELYTMFPVYFCKGKTKSHINYRNGSVKELEQNWNMAAGKVTWYLNLPSYTMIGG